MLKINELARLYLGVKGENNSRTIEIDMSAWAQIYPNATAVILHKRNGDQAKDLTGATYDSETKVLSWETSSYDTFYDGFGVAEIRMVEGDVVKKTKDMITTVTASSITNGSGQIVESTWQAFLNDVISTKGEAEAAQEAAEAAQEAAEEAQEKAEDAVTHAPYVDGTSGNWMVWDWTEEDYVDTGVHAQGPAGADGSNGQDGQDGADGFSPTASVTKIGKVATITITDKNGTTTAEVTDGADADPQDLIDDTAGAGDTNVTFSADKLTSDFSNVLSAIAQKVDKSALDNAGITDKSYSIKFGGEFSVTTAQTSGWNSPYAESAKTGVFNKVKEYRVTVNGTQYILPARLWFKVSSSQVKVFSYVGNLGLYLSDASGVPSGINDVPFAILSDIDRDSKIDVLTETAGTYTIKVEEITNTQTKLPNTLIYGDNSAPIEKVEAANTSFNGISLGINNLLNHRGTYAIGNGNEVSGQFNVVLSDGNTVTGENNIVAGRQNTVSGNIATVFGRYNNVSAGGYAFGEMMNVNAERMVAFGRSNVDANKTFPAWAANTEYKRGDIVTRIINTKTYTLLCVNNHTSPAEFSLDSTKWTICPSDGDTAFVIGIGTNANTKRNAVKFDWAGNAYLGGNVFVESNYTDSANGKQLPKDVQVNGTSILNNGVANVPIGSGNDVGVVKGGTGVGITSAGQMYLIGASSANVKNGSIDTKPIMPNIQHESTFYGLAKLAGADMASLSSVTVGQYPDAQKIAIQKMLGIYEAPWELIREDTFTNATEADHDITVDGNGNAFELTDIALIFWFPNQETAASKGNYGRVYYYWGTGNEEYCLTESGGFTESASANKKTGFSTLVEQKNGIITAMAGAYAQTGKKTGLMGCHQVAFFNRNWLYYVSSPKYFNKISITAVTGTGQYKLYGKRKWTV